MGSEGASIDWGLCCHTAGVTRVPPHARTHTHTALLTACTACRPWPWRWPAVGQLRNRGGWTRATPSSASTPRATWGTPSRPWSPSSCANPPGRQARGVTVTGVVVGGDDSEARGGDMHGHARHARLTAPPSLIRPGQGTSGRPPAAAELAEALQTRQLFVYCGHGSGEQYLPAARLRTLRCSAAGLIMGCSSGRLRPPAAAGDEAQGTVLAYLLAGRGWGGGGAGVLGELGQEGRANLRCVAAAAGAPCGCSTPRHC